MIVDVGYATFLVLIVGKRWQNYLPLEIQLMAQRANAGLRPTTRRHGEPVTAGRGETSNRTSLDERASTGVVRPTTGVVRPTTASTRPPVAAMRSVNIAVASVHVDAVDVVSNVDIELMPVHHQQTSQITGENWL